jgi:hypothetical protein
VLSNGNDNVADESATTNTFLNTYGMPVIPEGVVGNPVVDEDMQTRQQQIPRLRHPLFLRGINDTPADAFPLRKRGWRSRGI